ncbi:Alpha/Beta hydrolase protein [Syncephalastrum racemosum]|uniref:Alpha/Beta hydrolase protein n=1 Tax=Syncephalastrum racemosum TaxID=13706 RepID=A0A1X2H7U6_SYNRA|nr:Alpha/Beta hydrolase protein [Syncephalastrum racemosum]
MFMRMNITTHLLRIRARPSSFFISLLSRCVRNLEQSGGTRWKQDRHLQTGVTRARDEGVFDQRNSKGSFSSMRITTGASCLEDQDVESYTIPGARVYERFFDCPLDYNDPAGETIKVFVRHLVPSDQVAKIKTLPFLLYLQGGPGFECGLPESISGWHKAAFSHGYQLLLMDQRGTGLSSAITARSLSTLSDDDARAAYLTHFRADSIVRDCEYIRSALTDGLPNTKWSIIGQSFGGFCAISYLSYFPESLDTAFITGGVAPLVDNPDPVYRALYPRILQRNNIYYRKFPRDQQRVRRIHAHLSQNKVILPNGGTLSPRRFLQLGLLFGQSGGYDTVHQAVVYCDNDLERLGALTTRSLTAIQRLQDWDTNVLYAILHESIYCQKGHTSAWSAERVLQEEPFKTQFEWRLENLQPDQPVHFTGETIYPFMFEDYAELRPLKGTAEKIATSTRWGDLYDVDTLQKNQVRAVGVSYYDDMYVDLNLSVQTASQIQGFQQWITNEYAHNGVRADGQRVFNYLKDLASGDQTYNK